MKMKLKLKDIDWSEVMINVITCIVFVITLPFFIVYFYFLRYIINAVKWIVRRIRGVEEEVPKVKRKLTLEERRAQPRLPNRYENAVELFDLQGMTSKDLVYVANEENEVLNDLFEHHPEVIERWEEITGYSIVYLPNLPAVLQQSEVLQYYFPYMRDPSIGSTKIGNDYMLQQLVYPEDRETMRHGFLRTETEYRTCGGWKTFFAYYHPLTVDGEETLDEQIRSIANELKKDTAVGGVFYCGVKDEAGDDPEDFADNHFVSQKWEEDIHDLMDEVRERIEKLRQRGVAERLLEELVHPKEQLSKLIITKDYRIFLPAFNNMEIKMEPLVKAVYFLFLKHPEGLYFKQLPDHRKELTEIYLRLRPGELTPQMQHSIEDVTNPLSNSINEKCARIRAAFLTRFDDRLAQHYYITGQRAEPKRITLSRELVVWE